MNVSRAALCGALYLFPLLFIGSQTANAQSSYVTGENPGTIVNIDWATYRERPAIGFSRPFPTRVAWFETLELPTLGRWSKSTKQLVSANCDDGMIAILKSVEYFPGNKPGMSIEQEDKLSAYWYAVPGSIGYAKLQALCDH